jgi:hypothetical protein
MTHVRGHAYKRLWGSLEYDTRKYFSPFFSSSLLVTTLLWCWAAQSFPALLLAVHKEKGERDLRTVAAVKPTWGTPIRFLGNAFVRPLKPLRLRFMLSWGYLGSFTSTVCFIYFALIIQAPTKPKGEPMIPLEAMCWIHLVFVLVLLNIHENCHKLKFGFRIIRKFPTKGSMS